MVSLSMGFPRQEYWSGLPFPSPGDLFNLGSEPGSPALQADSLLSEPLEGGFLTTGPPGKSLLLGLVELLSEWNRIRATQALAGALAATLQECGLSCKGWCLDFPMTATLFIINHLPSQTSQS